MRVTLGHQLSGSLVTYCLCWVRTALCVFMIALGSRWRWWTRVTCWRRRSSSIGWTNPRNYTARSPSAVPELTPWTSRTVNRRRWTSATGTSYWRVTSTSGATRGGESLPAWRSESTRNSWRRQVQTCWLMWSRSECTTRRRRCRLTTSSTRLWICHRRIFNKRCQPICPWPAELRSLSTGKGCFKLYLNVLSNILTLQKGEKVFLNPLKYTLNKIVWSSHG